MFHWKRPAMINKSYKKRSALAKISPLEQLAAIASMSDDGDDNGIEFPGFEGMGMHHNIYSDANHIFFNNDIDEQNCFALCKEIRSLKNKLKNVKNNYESKEEYNIPIYLHLTTNGGCIHSAFTVIDCIKNLNYPVHSIVEGYVASAGTLISVSCEKRYITQNAYMLIHQLSSGTWGKMAEIDDQYENLKKTSEHIFKLYLDKTKIKERELQKFLKKDLNWNADESLKKGLVDEIWTA
jgi:ATP-dependent protease ClpP protease subunit